MDIVADQSINYTDSNHFTKLQAHHGWMASKKDSLKIKVKIYCPLIKTLFL
jgi:hypothetical protein